MTNEDESLVASLIASLSEDDSGLSLSDDEKAMLYVAPNLLRKLWSESAKAALLHHFPVILSAIIEKAKHGDVAAAKYITEFVAPQDEEEATAGYDVVKWETKALELRDRVGVELSAVELVEALLTYASTIPNTTLISILIPPAVD